MAGMPAGRIAVDLNERDVPTARDVQNEFSGKPHKRYQWTTHAVVQHLRSDATRGYVLHYPPGPKRVSLSLHLYGSWMRPENSCAVSR